MPADARRRTETWTPGVIALLAVASLGCVRPNASSAQSVDAQSRGNDFVRATAQEGAALMGPPPLLGSARAKKDLAAVLRAQETRSPADVERARSATAPNAGAFAQAIGNPVTAEDFPRLYAAINQALAACLPLCDTLKRAYDRPRPAAVDPRVDPALPTPQSGSYPSATAVLAWVAGQLLADLLPAQRAALEARAIEIGDLRVTAGAHFPSDVEAGRRLGASLSNEILSSEAWKERKQSLAGEIDRLRTRPPANVPGNSGAAIPPLAPGPESR